MATKTKRVSIDLPPPATMELDRLRKLTGLTTADLFRHSITLLRVYVNARIQGKEFRIIDPNNENDQIRLEMPISVETGASDELVVSE